MIFDKTNNKKMVAGYALVTDALWRKSLSAIRSLGKRGYKVEVMGDSIFTTGFWSKYTSRFFISPTAAENPAMFGTNLLKCLRLHAGLERPALLPMEDASLLWVAENFDAIKDLCHVLIPSKDAIAVAQSKDETLKHASALGLPTPSTYSARTFGDLVVLLRQLKQQSSKQFIVKPVRGSGSAGIKYDAYDSTIDWARHWAQYGPLIVQERLDARGAGIGVSILMDRHGECCAWFIHERLQQYPNSGGPSTDRRSIHHPELLEMSLRLLRSLNWKGIAMVEWKIDTATQKPMLMEINPRFWGSLELAVRAGVDFSYLYVLAAMGQPLPPIPEYRDGIRCRWLIPGEILRFLTQEKAQREPVGEFLRGLPGMAEEWDAEDWRGTLSAVLCPAINVLKPKYWKFLSR